MVALPWKDGRAHVAGPHIHPIESLVETTSTEL